ncbi:MAG: GpE family phage tail protein [Hyphomonadaceae bacterium]|nr:GpE family phage tail protein [Hyphomonadaceae bacterium]
MADIMAILPGLTLDRLEAMRLADLTRWHARAAARAPGSEK